MNAKGEIYINDFAFGYIDTTIYAVIYVTNSYGEDSCNIEIIISGS